MHRHHQTYYHYYNNTQGQPPQAQMADFVPHSTSDWAIEPSADPDDLALVAAFAEALPTAAVVGADSATLRQIQPYRAHTTLGAHNRRWDVHCWAMPAAAGASTAPVALCMHGHGHSCCVTSWAAFFALGQVPMAIRTKPT